MSSNSQETEVFTSFPIPYGLVAVPESEWPDWWRERRSTFSVLCVQEEEDGPTDGYYICIYYDDVNNPDTEHVSPTGWAI